jgi:hypothetical protein
MIQISGDGVHGKLRVVLIRTKEGDKLKELVQHVDNILKAEVDQKSGTADAEDHLAVVSDLASRLAQRLSATEQSGEKPELVNVVVSDTKKEEEAREDQAQPDEQLFSIQQEADTQSNVSSANLSSLRVEYAASDIAEKDDSVFMTDSEDATDELCESEEDACSENYQVLNSDEEDDAQVPMLLDQCHSLIKDVVAPELNMSKLAVEYFVDRAIDDACLNANALMVGNDTNQMHQLEVNYLKSEIKRLNRIIMQMNASVQQQ